MSDETTTAPAPEGGSEDLRAAHDEFAPLSGPELLSLTAAAWRCMGDLPRREDRRVLAEAAPRLLVDLARARAEIDRLIRERDLAVAHDTQPYPTTSAYEQACKALWSHRERAEQAEGERDQLKAAVAEFRTFLDDDFRQWCSPHGIAATYATSLIEELDRRIAPDQPGEGS